MKTQSFREEFFPSLPHVPGKSFVDDKPVTRGEYMRAKGEAQRTGQIIAEETHSAGGKTVCHVLVKLPE